MKTFNKKHTIAVATVTGLSFGVLFSMLYMIAAPALIYAQSESNTTSTATTTPSGSKGKFCSAIDDKIIKERKKLNEKDNAYGAKTLQRLTKIQQNRVRIDDQNDEVRGKWDENLAERYEKFLKKASSDADKQALLTFKATTTQALATRRQSVDAAIRTYRTGVDALITQRKADVASSSAAYKTSLEIAFTQAKIACASAVGTNATSSTATVKTQQEIEKTLREAIKKARDIFEARLKAIEKTNDAFSPLINARNIAVKKAQDTYKTFIEKALADLKAALGKK